MELTCSLRLTIELKEAKLFLLAVSYTYVLTAKAILLFFPIENEREKELMSMRVYFAWRSDKADRYDLLKSFT